MQLWESVKNFSGTLLYLVMPTEYLPQNFHGKYKLNEQCVDTKSMHATFKHKCNLLKLPQWFISVLPGTCNN